MTATTLGGRQASAASNRYFAARRLGHVNLYVSDVDRAYQFYHKVVGLDEAYVQPTNKAAFFTNNNTHHDVGVIDVRGPISRAQKPGLNHFGFELETEVDLVEAYDRAVADGVKFFMTQDHDIAHSVYGKDPDGNLSEMYADVVKDWRSARTGVVSNAKPKWSPGVTPPNAERNYHVDPALVRVPGAVFQPRRIVHATLVVADFSAAFDFYSRIVGLDPLIGHAGSPFAVFGGTCGERSLSLFRAGEGRRPGLHHFGFELWSQQELTESVDRARANGLAIEAEINHRSRRSVYVRDPDGFLIQFFVDINASAAGLDTIEESLALYVL